MKNKRRNACLLYALLYNWTDIGRDVLYQAHFLTKTVISDFKYKVLKTDCSEPFYITLATVKS